MCIVNIVLCGQRIYLFVRFSPYLSVRSEASNINSESSYYRKLTEYTFLMRFTREHGET
jgi:hypothetical protein